MLLICEEVKETILDFLQRTMEVLNTFYYFIWY